MSERETLTTNQLIVKLHDELTEYRDEACNFASFLRVCCSRYMSLLAGRIAQDSNQPAPLRAIR